MRRPSEGGDGGAKRARGGLYTPGRAAGAPCTASQADVLYIAIVLATDTPVGVPNKQRRADGRGSGRWRCRGYGARRGRPGAPGRERQDVGAEGGNGGGLRNASPVGDDGDVALLARGSGVLAGADGAVAPAAEPPTEATGEVVGLEGTLEVDGSLPPGIQWLARLCVMVPSIASTRRAALRASVGRTRDTVRKA